MSRNFGGGAFLGFLQRFNSCKKCKNRYNSDIKYHKRGFGFTLAEVLITLGIVGVVAALTIPSLISKYNEYVTIIALKKTYAELTEAIKRSELVNGDFRDWDYSYDWRKGRDFAKRYIFPYLSQNYTQCTRYNCFAGQGCWKNVSGNKDVTASCNYASNSFRYNDKIIHIAPRISDCTPSGNLFCTPIKYVNIIVDINGDKGDSIMGKDVFYFTLFNYTYKTGGWSTSGLCPKGEHYGLRQGTIAGYWGAYCRPLENMFSGNPGSCKEGGSGYDCGLAIEKNKWKIPDKYPIKF